MKTKHPPRITVIVTEEFKDDLQIKCIKKGTELSELTRKLLKQWLESK